MKLEGGGFELQVPLTRSGASGSLPRISLALGLCLLFLLGLIFDRALGRMGFARLRLTLLLELLRLPARQFVKTPALHLRVEHLPSTSSGACPQRFHPFRQPQSGDNLTRFGPLSSPRRAGQCEDSAPHPRRLSRSRPRRRGRYQQRILGMLNRQIKNWGLYELHRKTSRVAVRRKRVTRPQPKAQTLAPLARRWREADFEPSIPRSGRIYANDCRRSRAPGSSASGKMGNMPIWHSPSAILGGSRAFAMPRARIRVVK